MVPVPLQSSRRGWVGECAWSFAVVYGGRDQRHTHTARIEVLVTAVIDRSEIISGRSTTMTTIMCSGDSAAGCSWLKIIRPLFVFITGER
ncbi:unnamed protein product [Macrosiphum euphorbiae]|uniref:Uncharacterized protein n=1 Tax=Macrosiphum euphorbiae TaxID=13131 RepID=A0AAV0VTP6_9HEMI|nr:unnamed protein product [Macrosiphum euphorbiae]